MGRRHVCGGVREPGERRRSRRVLRGAWGEIPPGYPTRAWLRLLFGTWEPVAPILGSVGVVPT